MDLEKIAHDITISLLPRALDRHKIHNEWQEVGDDVIAFAKDSSVLLGLQEEEKSRKDLGL
ncbi:TPA: uracil-DNA glycosylase [Staphylococcus aureus]|nr:uracil-DNA glycosylase [Staphylococcus aureus]HDF7127553.1 uracil-DNA glycosylase [Staphylococcus aureus]